MINTLSIWDKVAPLTELNGVTSTAEQILAAFPIANAEKVLIETNPSGRLIAIDDLDTWIGICGIDPMSMTDAEIVAEIMRIRSTPPVAQGDPDGITPDEIIEILDGGSE